MINKAIEYTVRAHEGQLRKGTNMPFIVHPLEVGVLVSQMTSDVDIICAAFLHDTVEDCKHIEISDIEKNFGQRVAHMVACESEDKSKTWMERKGHTIQFLKEEAPLEVCYIALADKLSNVKSMVRDYKVVGEELWTRFNMKDKKMHAWYYISLMDSLSRMKHLTQYDEYTAFVHELFAEEIKEF